MKSVSILDQNRYEGGASVETAAPKNRSVSKRAMEKANEAYLRRLEAELAEFHNSPAGPSILDSSRY